MSSLKEIPTLDRSSRSSKTIKFPKKNRRMQEIPEVEPKGLGEGDPAFFAKIFLDLAMQELKRVVGERDALELALKTIKGVKS